MIVLEHLAPFPLVPMLTLAMLLHPLLHKPFSAMYRMLSLVALCLMSNEDTTDLKMCPHLGQVPDWDRRWL